jgi:hypothetical protein
MPEVLLFLFLGKRYFKLIQHLLCSYISNEPYPFITLQDEEFLSRDLRIDLAKSISLPFFFFSLFSELLLFLENRQPLILEINLNTNTSRCFQRDAKDLLFSLSDDSSAKSMNAPSKPAAMRQFR